MTNAPPPQFHYHESGGSIHSVQASDDFETTQARIEMMKEWQEMLFIVKDTTEKFKDHITHSLVSTYAMENNVRCSLQYIHSVIDYDFADITYWLEETNDKLLHNIDRMYHRSPPRNTKKGKQVMEEYSESESSRSISSTASEPILPCQVKQDSSRSQAASMMMMAITLWTKVPGVIWTIIINGQRTYIINLEHGSKSISKRAVINVLYEWLMKFKRVG